jgi:hypothetical protein
MQCNTEHQTHSFIIDANDKNWSKYEVFTDAELEEIELHHQKPTPQMTVPLRDYLNRFNKTSTSELCQGMKLKAFGLRTMKNGLKYIFGTLMTQCLIIPILKR